MLARVTTDWFDPMICILEWHTYLPMTFCLQFYTCCILAIYTDTSHTGVEGNVSEFHQVIKYKAMTRRLFMAAVGCV